MNTEDQFEAQKKALEFQEIYYPGEWWLKQHAQSEAIRFAYSQGFEMAQIAMQKRLNQALLLLEDAKTHIEDNCDSGMSEWLQNADEILGKAPAKQRRASLK